MNLSTFMDLKESRIESERDDINHQDTEDVIDNIICKTYINLTQNRNV